MYEHSIAEIRKRLNERCPGISPVMLNDISSKEKVVECLVAHILGMLKEIELGMVSPPKAGMWMGWVYRALEAYPLQLIDNEQSREWARQDAMEVRAGCAHPDIHWVQRFLTSHPALQVGFCVVCGLEYRRQVDGDYQPVGEPFTRTGNDVGP